MAWLRTPPRSSQELAALLRERLREPLVLPGVYDPLSALLAKGAGFTALYLSGAALTASRGLPDLGLLEAGEVAERAREIVWATGLPLIVDADTGYGGPLNAAQAARRFLAAGVAGVQLEDQLHPKKCGHLSRKLLAPPEDLEAKLRAVKEAAPELFLIARTDAYEAEGLEGVVARARRYLEAGAEAIFPEALPSREAFQAVAEALEGAVLLANLTEFGRSPSLSAAEVFALGYRIALFPVSALRVAAKAMEGLYQTLMAQGTSRGFLPQMQTRAELYRLLDYFAYEEFDARLMPSELPGEA
ncbi:MAG: isocitrate lyase/phosphoenolpyruvate mutase family protein [Meiothermus sp.]|uniref:isocitrate lyase/PEP mutase family protein n=1 Tax=Meiothermus sp. TaxID=1955249 RepID=UPI0025D0CF98|nr:isocitrate lyase/phosphoenolpyruvate mutase family protein [Meiothermus sp.]MCS7058140.1 isocitrate lyase/phosphoenolpyruvate mutase family protein [Meiothermus sp.]MCS7194337.1 isocitrate lyase/phosphoenolpyruvate mutase family protein [Meiothermus sp.]MCX7740045.1 isocitrate lyase/phosphoenolpyruvate mutase family protein [Meiothermus sp.]MDW8089818.1 isocitrate lyase/phosphoenolpyruvate mutase family protein [Meiothermus sp.]MDW8481755.1 isocitrate lyase/phosphoenolpyruvate mutase family